MTKLLSEHRRKCQYRKRILFYLKREGLTQVAWCRRHGMDKAHVNRLLNLKTRPTPHWAFRLAQATGGACPALDTLIEADYLSKFFWKGQKAPKARPTEKRILAKTKRPPKSRPRRKHLNVINAFG